MTQTKKSIFRIIALFMFSLLIISGCSSQDESTPIIPNQFNEGTHLIFLFTSPG